jgi:hypothetical protein
MAAPALIGVNILVISESARSKTRQNRPGQSGVMLFRIKIFRRDRGRVFLKKIERYRMLEKPLLAN